MRDQLYDNQNRHREVREAVIRELESNRERYIGDLFSLRVADRAEYEVEAGIQSHADMDQEAMWEAYIAELRTGPIRGTTFGWGDDITLRAAANSYGVHIQLYGDSGHLVEYLHGTTERTLNIFNEFSHYTSLRQRIE